MPFNLMRSSCLSLLGALVVWISIGVVESVDSLKRTHLGNFNYSYFSGYLFTSASGICFDNPDYQTLGFIDKFTDALDVSAARPLGVLSYYTSRVVLNQSIILFDLGYKAVTQKIILGTNDLITITVDELEDQSHTIDIDFPVATCEKQSTLANTNDNSSVSQNVTCATVYGNITLSYKLIQTVNRTVAYQCNFQTVKIAPIKTSPVPGYRLDWNVTWDVDPVYRKTSFPLLTAPIASTQTAVDYTAIVQDITHKVLFESKEPVPDQQLRVSVGLMNFEQTVLERGCAQRIGDRCTECQESYTLVNGECLCNRNGAIATINPFEVTLPDPAATVTKAKFLQAGCRKIGSAASAAQSVCETNLDFILRNNFTVSLTRSAANMGDLIVGFNNLNNTLASVATGCPDTIPSFSLSLVVQGKPKGFGRYGLSHPLVSNHKVSTATGGSFVTITLSTLVDYLNYFCRSIPLSDVAMAYDCLLRGQLGPSPTLATLEYSYRLGIIRSSSFSTGTKMDTYLLDLSTTRYFFGALSQTDSNMTTRVMMYNTSDTTLTTTDYNQRFLWSDAASVEKSQILRLTFEMNNLTQMSRYSLSEVKISAIRTDEPESPYVGHTCNTTVANIDFFQSAVIDCTFSLKDNVTFMVNWTLSRRSGNTFPESIKSNHLLMFEVYQQHQLILLAGLSFGVTVGVVIAVLLLMTSGICYLAYKAGAVENLQQLKEGLAKGLKDGMENINEIFKKDKDGKGVNEKLVDGPKKKKKRKARQDQDDDDDDVEDELSKVNVSEIKPKKEQGDDSILKGTKAKGNILAMLDGDKRKKASEDDDDDLDDEELKPKKPVKKGSERTSVVSKKVGKDTSKDKITKAKKTSDDEERFSDDDDAADEPKKPAPKKK